MEIMRNCPEIRKEIDSIDAAMLTLFERRMQCAREMGYRKKEDGSAIYLPDREDEVLNGKLDRLDDKTLAHQAESYFRLVMNLSKNEQLGIIGLRTPAPPAAVEGAKVVYQGVPGAFSEQAALEYFGNNGSITGCETFEDVFKAITAGHADYGVLPIENSTGGSINEVYDLLDTYGCYIVGEHVVPVSQCLMALPGADRTGLGEVYSHPQGLKQCARYLREHGLTPKVYGDTAAAAEYVAKSGRRDIAAIASRRAADLYGLDILEANIQDHNDNFTRFLVVAWEQQRLAGRGKISVAITIRHAVGTLHRILAQRNLNLTKIESRNIPGRQWEYRFYVDFEGDVQQESVQQILEELKELTIETKLLGYYK